MTGRQAYKEVEYQTRKVDAMMERIRGRDTIALQAPTGAGKTVIMARFLDRFVEENPDRYAYIWASPRRGLPEQSRDKLERYFEDTREVATVLREELGDYVERDCIWFANWEYLTGLISKEGEGEAPLEDIVRRTRERGSDIMLIIDESHWGAEAGQDNRVREAIGIIDPEKKIHVTATPRADVRDEDPITHDEVRAEGIIVNSIQMNPGMSNEDIHVNDKLIGEGIKRRMRLKDIYDEHGIPVNPLLLIQVPNSRIGNETIDQARGILRGCGISDEKGNLRVWTADSHVRDSDIRENSSGIDALIFKQAISLGWDCPRAQVLVALRALKDDSFGIQTLGRIIRTAEQRHYAEDNELNDCYLYTASTILAGNNRTIKSVGSTRSMSLRRRLYGGLGLPRHYPVKPNIEDFDQEFYDIFLELAMRPQHNGKNTAKSMDHDPGFRPATLPANRKLDTDIRYKELDINGDKATFRENYTDTYKALQDYVRDVIMRLKFGDLFRYRAITEFTAEGIYRLFQRSGYDGYDQAKIVNIVLGNDNNMELLRRDLSNTLEELRRRIVSTEAETVAWDIEPSQLITVDDEIEPDGGSHPHLARDYSGQFSKYVMEPAYVKIDSVIELNFCRFLDRSDGVVWWYKNDVTKKSFGIPYIKDNKYHAFMPDFIVRMKRGRTGIFDTKLGETLELAAEKAEALAGYVGGDPNLRGGIVTNYDTRWMVHSSVPYNANIHDPGWETLNLDA
ncbi:MAG: DEAD/DEAH box helicase family protein [Nitrosopumilus sp.]|nr:DEAD/DEAH box helicase family protein [Nitrosopumilus sp.]